MEANIRPKETFRSAFEGIFHQIQTCHFRIHILRETFVIAAFESNNRNTAYINGTKLV